MSFRNQINEDITQNLYSYLQENQEKIYKKSLKYVNQKTGMVIDFPQDSPYSLEQLLNQNRWN